MTLSYTFRQIPVSHCKLPCNYHYAVTYKLQLPSHYASSGSPHHIHIHHQSLPSKPSVHNHKLDTSLSHVYIFNLHLPHIAPECRQIIPERDT